MEGENRKFKIAEKKLDVGRLRKLLIRFSTHFLILCASWRQVQPAERGYTHHALSRQAMQGHNGLVGTHLKTKGLPIVQVPNTPHSF